MTTAGPTFDPFEAGFDVWPYDQYRRLRESDPVHWSDLLCGWVLTRFDDVSRVLREKCVSSELDRAAPSPVVDLLRARQANRGDDALTLVLLDDPRHARIRRLLQAPFTARAVDGLRATVEKWVSSAVEDLAPHGAMELVGEVAYPLPVAFFCEMLGIPEEVGPRFRTWTAAVARSLDLVINDDEYDACMALLAEMEAYLSAVADAKRADPADDVLSALVHAEVDGDRLSHEELVAQLVTLYVAGHEPTTALIGNGVAALLRHPEQLERLQADPSLVTGAVPELLRYDGPNQFVRRIAVEPMTIGDRTIDAGDVLYVGIGAANHDPERWGKDADELRVDRPDAAQHVQFGVGVHHCLGAHLARLQADVALTALLGRLGPIRADGEVTWSGRSTLRSVATVPVAWAT